MKSLQDHLKESIKEEFDRFALYNYGKEPNNPIEEQLFLILDEDDVLNTAFHDYERMLLEWDNYQQFPPTKCVYRLDKAKNTTGQQRHIHVFADKAHNHQLYAINIDGTPHDGSKYQLNQKHQKALRNIGFPVPENGILEWHDWNGCRLIMD